MQRDRAEQISHRLALLRLDPHQCRSFSLYVPVVG